MAAWVLASKGRFVGKEIPPASISSDALLSGVLETLGLSLPN